MNVAIVQLNIEWENRSANHGRVAELLQSAKIPADSMIVLPEMFDTGFSMNTQRTLIGADHSVAYLSTLAREHSSCIVAGVVGSGSVGKAKNQALVMSAAGGELCRYTKQYRFSPSGEDKLFDRGDEPHMFQWQTAKIAPLICYDLRFPEAVRPIARSGAEVLLYIANWPASRIGHWSALLRARAIENQAVVVGVNRCGSSPDAIYNGRSSGFDAQGETLFELDDEEQVFQLQVDVEAVRLWREQFPALREHFS